MSSNEKLINSFVDFLRAIVILLMVIATIYLAQRIRASEERLQRVEKIIQTKHQ